MENVRDRHQGQYTFSVSLPCRRACVGRKMYIAPFRAHMSPKAWRRTAPSKTPDLDKFKEGARALECDGVRGALGRTASDGGKGKASAGEAGVNWFRRLFKKDSTTQ